MSIHTEYNNSLKSDLMEKLRNELPVLRAKIRISQEIIAEKVGLSRQTYNSIETGKKDMTWTVFLALVAFFQNNEQTKPIIEQVNGFKKLMLEIMELSEHDCTSEKRKEVGEV